MQIHQNSIDNNKSISKHWNKSEDHSLIVYSVYAVLDLQVAV